MRWSTSSLLRKLRSILRSERLVIKLSPLNNAAAEIKWDSDAPIVVKVDPDQDGIITCVIHELLHFALSDCLGPFDGTDLEEPIILALERHLYSSLTPRQLSGWRRAIRRKLDGKH